MNSGADDSPPSGSRSTDRLDRIEALADDHPVGIGRFNVSLLFVRGVRRIVEVRVTGLAAEMTYYAIISVLPLITALGATLGFLERFLDAAQVEEMQAGLVGALATLFNDEVTGDFLLPLVEGLLREERAGVALGSVLVALWLAARMFRAAIRALDDAYIVEERRGLLAQWGLGLVLALGAVLTLVVVLALVVVGPLLGGGQRIAEWLGLGATFELLWSVARWPFVLLLCIGFLVVLYLYGPNVDNTRRDCLPGALFGTLGLIGVAAGFQVYLAVAGPSAPQVGEAGEAVAVAAQVIGAVLASALWLWLSSIVLLAGGVLNAEVQRMRAEVDATGP